MPKLRTVYTTLDDVPEAMREFYLEVKDKEGNVTGYSVDLDDDVKSHPTVSALQNAHEAQKKTNRELKDKLAELQKKIDGLPEDFDFEEIEQLRETKKLYDDLKEKGADDPEKKRLHQQEVESIKKMHDQQLARAKKQMDDALAERDKKIGELTATIKTMVVSDNLSRQLVEVGVKKEALPFVSAKIERSVKVSEEEGEFKAVVDTDLGEVPLDQFIKKWSESDEAKMFVEQASGGGATGSSRKSAPSDANPWAKTTWNMRQQADILAKDAARADRLAKAAGHKKAVGALMMDAK